MLKMQSQATSFYPIYETFQLSSAPNTILLEEAPGYASLPACRSSMREWLRTPSVLEAMHIQALFIVSGHRS
jgi:hypothetical protein